ncbi:DNA-3-methyladenine glycosylase family protein [Zavarzinia compransoris]|uniref:DNA-3-methyladenine glycosylase II n=1 Tax=Zavarzinia compransoris TaxID=1264899 RepID=A0A317E4R6_9PROT|nr:DNA-3-methyladenine glycosylase [Zavarzinia compransoris]PWR22057.1 DNA glycosylase [Zavarzinia compransoris]TDP47201.1 DNA-3-methyladenine glycosylase II [Zavarzinia compransoris]
MSRAPVDHETALARLARKCRHMRRALAEAGSPPPRVRRPGFAALARIIVEQQVSVAAGAAIWAKFEAGVGGSATPAAVLAFDEEELRPFGLSRPKARYIRALAESVASGTLDLDRVDGLPDAEAIAELTAVKGIGRWTAEIYLMFALGRMDLWPALDLALAEGAYRLMGLDGRPDPKTLDEIGRRWSPHRSTAALVIWRYYAYSRQKPAS